MYSHGMSVSMACSFLHRGVLAVLHSYEEPLGAYYLSSEATLREGIQTVPSLRG